MNKPLLKTKMENELNKRIKHLLFDLRNININGNKRGCSGFILNLDTSAVVYINTEPVSGKYLYRYANNNKDYTGYQNHYATNITSLINSVVEFLKIPVRETNECRI